MLTGYFNERPQRDSSPGGGHNCRHQRETSAGELDERALRGTTEGDHSGRPQQQTSETESNGRLQRDSAAEDISKTPQLETSAGDIGGRLPGRPPGETTAVDHSGRP